MAEFENSFFNRYKASKKKTSSSPRGKTRQKTSNRPTPEQVQRVNAATAQLGEKIKSIAAPYGELQDMKETSPVDYDLMKKQAGQRMDKKKRIALEQYFPVNARAAVGLATLPAALIGGRDSLRTRALSAAAKLDPLLDGADMMKKATTQSRGGLSEKDAFTQEMLKIMNEKKQ